MKRLGILMTLLFMQASFTLTVNADDFDWLGNLNIKAEADSSGYQIRLATRFHIGDTEVKAVIGNADNSSDAYMILRLSELSHQPVDEVLKVYRTNKGKGWGVMAKRLGIQPGSREFHALKQGHDLDKGIESERGQSSGKGKGKHKNKS